MTELVAVEGAPGPAWLDELRRWWDRGDAVLPVDHRLPPAARATLFARLRPTLVTTAGSGDAARLSGRPAEAGDAIVLATSGTTGEPKGVVLTHDAVEASAEVTSGAVGADPHADTWVCCLPLGHAGGLGVLTRAMHTGTPVSILAGFEAGAVTAEATRITTAGRRVLVSLVATALRRVDAGLFGVVLLGGDAPPVWEAPAWPGGRPAAVVTTYGLTETAGGCVYDGVVLAGVEARVDAGGEVWIRGPVLGRAYRGPDADRPLAGPDGWFATGDGGAWDGGQAGRAADGVSGVVQARLVVKGRLADAIVTGGETVWPGPVETILRGCPGVAAVAVVGRRDPEWGALVVAVVVPTDPGDPPTLDSLRAAVRARLAPWAAPRALELVDVLPTTGSGKTRRAALR